VNCKKNVKRDYPTRGYTPIKPPIPRDMEPKALASERRGTPGKCVAGLKPPIPKIFGTESFSFGHV